MNTEKIVEENVLKMNITKEQAATYGGVLVSVGVVILITTGPMILYTFITKSPTNMKNCEKLIICNVLFPDLVVGLLLTQVLGPAIINRVWSYTIFATRWLAFFHTACVFHAHLAIGFICYVIALSLRDSFRFEGANDMKHMSAMVVCICSLTVCFCSLPGIEKEGYNYVDNWLGPWFNVQYQFGSVFMVLAQFGVILPVDIASIVKLFEAKRLFKQQGTKITRRSMDDLNKVIQFCFLATFCACLIIPTAFVVKNLQAMLVIRLAVYLSAVVRVFALLYMCPHFQFGRSAVSDDYMDDFAKLGEESDDDLMSEKLESIIGGDEEDDA